MMSPIEYLTTEEVAARVRLSPRTLERMRREGNGPEFSKSGSRAIYSTVAVQRWLEARTFASTSDARRAGVK
jgi:transcriptional regulator GlxA family with amidase domain